MVAKNKTGYDADNLTHLEGLDAVRKRPGMYVGSTDTRGLTHLAYEIMDNSVDEALAGYCTNINIIAYPDGSVEVSDDGRGIPIDINTKSGLSGVELVMTKLHAGGKFGDSGYKTAGGLHGVGASVTNALSSRVDVTVKRDNGVYEISFQRGVAGVFSGKGPEVKFTKKAGLRNVRKMKRGEKNGTTVRFWPDMGLFLPGAHVDVKQVVMRARQTAFLVSTLTLTIDDRTEEKPEQHSFQFSGGLSDMVDFLAIDTSVSPTVRITGEGKFKETVPVFDNKGHMVNTEVERTVEVDVAFRWGTGYEDNVKSFVNVVATINGGTQVKGFERGLAAVFKKSYDGTRLLKANEATPNLEDILEGMTGVVSVSVPEPQFIGQTKDELGTAAVTKVVQDIVSNGFKAWLASSKNKTAGRTILEKVANASRARLAARTHREAARRKTALEGASMPSKLVDCRANGVDRSELFLVEGDSALGSGRQGRNSEYQALLPLRGKILNVQKATLKQVLDNAECSAIIQVIGAGSGRTFDLEQMRYGKILLMADADVDGSHIRVLLITLFFAYMRPIIEAGRLYAAMPPLHKIETTGRSKETVYTYTHAEMERKVAELKKAGKTIKSPIQRYKGLGEMSETELWETTMDPKTRSVRRITLEDAAEAARMLELLMGSAVEARREFIVSNADQIETIDV